MSFKFNILALFLLLVFSQQMIFAFGISGGLLGRKYQLRNQIISKQRIYDQTNSELLAKEIFELKATLLSVEKQLRLVDKKNWLRNKIRIKESAYAEMGSSLFLRSKMQMAREISKLKDEFYSVEVQIDNEKAKLLKLDIERNKGTELGYFYQFAEKLRKQESQYKEKKKLYLEIISSWKNFLPFKWSKGMSGQLARELSELRDEIKLTLEKLDVQRRKIYFNTKEKINVKKSNPAEKLNEEDDLNEKVDYHASQNDYISSCVDRVSEGKEIYHSKFFNPTLCRKLPFFPDRRDSSPSKYTIQKREGRIVIKTSLYANYRGNIFNRKEALEDIRETIPCIKDFYAKHGIKLDLTIRGGDDPLDIIRSDHFINFYDNLNRSYVKDWAIYTTQKGNQVYTKNTRCGLFIHELGHNFGLPDTYPESRCPDRERIMPFDDIMRSSSHFSPYETKFYPYAIEILLKPLCGEMPSQ